MEKGRWKEEELFAGIRLSPIILLFALLAFGGSAVAGERSSPLKVGDEAPAFYLPTLKGGDFFLRDYCGAELRQPRQRREKRVVILSFFATWCEPCRKELPQIQEIARRYGDKPVEVRLIDLKEKPDSVRVFVKQQRVEVGVLLDRYGKVADRYGVGSLPALFVLDREGRVAYVSRQYQEDLGAALEWTLKGMLGPPIPNAE